MIELKMNHWHLAYKLKEETTFRLLKNGCSYWLADPFPFYYKNDLYVFAELYYYAKQKGVIGYARYVDGKFSTWKIALEEPWHLSFPNIIENNGQIYMYPEGYKSGKFYAYKLVEFPHKWKRLEPILDNGGLYVDSFFSYINNIPYLFAYKMDSENHAKGNLEIYKCSSDNKIEHLIEMNVIPKYSRPAGSVFMHNSIYIRAAQNCEQDYGYGLVFYKIKKINESEYEEELLRELYPKNIVTDSYKNFCGLHTYNECKDFQVIDLKTKNFNIVEFFYRIMRKVYSLMPW